MTRLPDGLREAPTEAKGRSRFVDANGVRLHFLEYGDEGKQPLVILPGITSPAITWEFVALELARDYHVFTMDVRGRGLSEVGPTYEIAALAKDVADSLVAFGLKRPAVLGHSAGARMASAFGALYPDRRGPLIVADPPLSGPGRAPYPTPVDAFIESLRLAQSGATADDMRPFFPTWTDEQLALRAAWLATCDEHAVVETHRLFHEEDFFEYWPRLEPPTLFVWAGAAPVVSKEGAAEVAAANPRAEVVELPGAGHMLPWDDLAGFLAVVQRFID
jgi:N-formylmaleamate deformylase